MRKVIFLAVAIIILIIIYSLITQIFSAFHSGDRLTESLDKLHQLQVKNQALKKSLTEASSPEFIEQQARDQLGLAKEGEVIVVIPDELIHKILSQQSPNSPRLSNPQGWWQLFFK